MLKKYLVPLSLLLLLFALLLFGWGTFQLLNSGAQSLLTSADRIQGFLEKEDWGQANLIYREVENKWHKFRVYWPMLIHHQEIDRIEESMSKLKSYLKNEKLSDAGAELNNLIHYIKHIPEKERFNLQNIL